MISKISGISLIDKDDKTLLRLNRALESMDALARVAWALEYLPQTQVVSSSFGIQSAVMLHLMARLQPQIPVVLIDTGYLFAETYQFIDRLSDQLELNLQVYRPIRSAAWQEARHGQLWQEGKAGIDEYNRSHKVEPMRRALQELQVATWYVGLRREQSTSRESLPVLRLQQDRFKVHPLVDWSKRDIHRYLNQHDLPYHPLWQKGYQTVGDAHSSQPLQTGQSEEQSRFSGLVRECGLHL